MHGGRKHNSVAKAVGLLMALAMLAAACGGGSEIEVAEGSGEDSTEEADGTSTDSSGDADGSDDGNTEGGEDAEPEADPDPDPDESSDDGDDSTDEGNAPSTGGGGGEAICALGAEFEDDQTFTNVSIFDGEEFFEVTGDAWARAAAVAPGELDDEVAVITDGLAEMEAIFVEYDYDVFDPGLQAAMESFDTTPMDEAGAAFSDYMADVCGIDIATAPTQPSGPADVGIDPEDLENLDFDDPAAVLTQIFGVDQETAECLVEELGGFDENAIDPATLNDAICGTTLLEVITGAGG